MEEVLIIIYGTSWCGDCARARLLLTNLGVQYRWVNIDHDNDGELYVIKVNRGMRSVPTILFGDGSILVEPSCSELKTKLKLLGLI